MIDTIRPSCGTLLTFRFVPIAPCPLRSTGMTGWPFFLGDGEAGAGFHDS
jgi:hypothetical protein